MKGTLSVSKDAAANKLVNSDPFALVLAMMLDQQIPMERAFLSPYQLDERMNGKMSVDSVANTNPDELERIFKIKPALHRFPRSMAKRAGVLCQHILDEHGGKAERIWLDATDADDLFARIKALPGYGDEKTKIFIAILAKRFGHRPKGWEKKAGSFADKTPRSVADIDSPEALAKVRAWKKAQKAKGKTKQE